MRLLILPSFFFLNLFFITSICLAENLLQSFEEVKQGSLSISELLEKITTSDSPTISAEVSRYKHLVPSLSETSASVLLSKIRTAVTKSDFDKVLQIKSLSDTLLPKSWPESTRITKLSQQAAKIKDVKENILALNSIYEAKLIQEDKKALEIAAKKKAKEIVTSANNPFQALSLASKVAVVFPNLDVGEKDFFTTLNNAASNNELDLSEWNFDIPDVKEYVFDFLDKSEENKNLVTNLYILKTIDSFKQGNENRAEVYYKLIEPHLSPDKKLSTKRKILELGLDGSYSNFVQSIAKELKNDLSSGEKLKLLFKGFYGWWIFIIPLLLFLLPVLFLLRPRKKTRLNTNAVIKEDEYSKLLKQFGLEENASESEIKKAFRLLVKKHHPDAHGTDGVVLDSEGNPDKQFEELRKSYNRLLDIRSSWFGN